MICSALLQTAPLAPPRIEAPRPPSARPARRMQHLVLIPIPWFPSPRRSRVGCLCSRDAGVTPHCRGNSGWCQGSGPARAAAIRQIKSSPKTGAAAAGYGVANPADIGIVIDGETARVSPPPARGAPAGAHPCTSHEPGLLVVSFNSLTDAASAI